jgi:predicted RNA binding protein YcfA (HicA-like mRNA interferase family)
MTPLPVVSGRQARQAFERLGWRFLRMRGSHMILAKAGSLAVLSIPDHDPVGRGLLRSLIRDAEISVEEFAQALKS